MEERGSAAGLTLEYFNIACNHTGREMDEELMSMDEVHPPLLNLPGSLRPLAMRQPAHHAIVRPEFLCACEPCMCRVAGHNSADGEHRGPRCNKRQRGGQRAPTGQHRAR